MSNSLAKKIFASAVAAASILSAVPAASVSAHAVDSFVKDGSTVYFLANNGQKMPFTSYGAAKSYGFYADSKVVAADAQDLALPTGSFIPPQDGKIFCATETKGSDVAGECSLITGGQKAAFTSAAVFTGLGFSFSRAFYGDSSFLTKSTNIDNASAAHRPGVLVNNSGTVQLVGQSSLLGIPSLEVFNSFGFSFADVVPANGADKTIPQTGVMTARQPGQLNPTGTTTPTPSGAVTINLSSNTAPAATVPQSATNIPLLKFSLNNGSASAVTVNQIVVHRTGSGATTDFDNVYLYNGATRMSSGRSINSSTNDATFSSLNLTIPANGSVVIDVTGDTNSSAGAGNVHTFVVNNVALTSGSTSGSATGNTMTIAGVDAGTITVAKSGSFSNPKVGQTNVKVGEFQVSASSAEDLTLKRVSLFQSGSISRTNLSNFKLMQNGSQLGSVSSIDAKDHITFDGLNFNLEKGNTRVFEIFADVAPAAKANDTIKLYVEESTDVFAQGKTYGFGASVTRTSYDGDSCTSTAGDCSYSAIEGGQLTVTFNGPAGNEVAKDGKDVEVLNFTLAAQSNLEIRQFGLDFDGGSGTADFDNGGTPNYTDVKVWDTTTNTVVWGPLDFNDASATSESMTFSDDVTLAAGTSRTYKVTLDIANSSDVSDGDTLRAIIDMDDLFSSQVKNIDNNTFLTSSEIVPGSDVNGNTMTVRAQSLTVTLAATPTSQTYIKGSTDKAFVGFNLAAGNGADVKVQSIKVTCYIDASNVNTDFVQGQDADVSGTVDCLETVPTLKLKVDGTQIGDLKSPGDGTDGTATFNNLNLTIPKGTSKVVVVYADISSSAYRNSNVERVSFDIATAATDITSTDPNGNSITETGDAVNGGTSPNRIITVENAGTLTAALAPTETDLTDSHIVVAGKSNVVFTKVKFTAANEELKLTKLRVNLVSAAAASDVADDVTAVTLWDGATMVAGPITPSTGCASGTLDACADFNTFSSNFIVPKDSDKTLTVAATINTVSGGADSGDELSLDVDFDTNFEARGTSGSTQLTAITSAAADISGNDMVLRKSQPKIELVSLNSTSLTNGTLPILKFKVTAVDGDVSIKHIDFSTVVSDDAGITLSAPAVREAGTGVDLGAVVAITDGATTPSNVSFTSEQQISAGTSKTYEFRVNVAGAGAADTLATQILGDTAAVTGELDDTDTTVNADLAIDDLDALINVGNDSAAPSEYNFIWSDMSGSLNSSGTFSPAHNDTLDQDALDDGADNTSASNDWTNGRYVRVVPTDTQTMTFPS